MLLMLNFGETVFNTVVNSLAVLFTLYNTVIVHSKFNKDGPGCSNTN